MEKREEVNRKLIIFICILILLIVIFSLYFIFNSGIDIGNKEGNKELNFSDNTVIEIIDGDTFKLYSGEIVRLLCVDTPEKGDSGYEDAKDFLEQKILYREVILEGNETDAYNRSLRWVYVDSVLINREIVELELGEVFEWGEECGRVR